MRKNLYLVYDEGRIDFKISLINDILLQNGINDKYYNNALKNIKRVIKKYSLSSLSYEQLYNRINININ